MIKAHYSDKDRVIDILSRSFVENKSVNYVVKQDKKKLKRFQYLMDYCFEVCWKRGEVYMTKDKKGAALLVIPQNKKTNLKAILLDLKLAFRTIGLIRVIRVLSRESAIKKLHPKTRVQSQIVENFNLTKKENA